MSINPMKRPKIVFLKRVRWAGTPAQRVKMLALLCCQPEFDPRAYVKGEGEN